MTQTRLAHANCMWRALNQLAFFHAPSASGRLAAVGHAVLAAADQVAERVAPERVARDQHDIDRQDEAADADAGVTIATERVERVLAEDHDEDQREVQRVAVQVLEERAARSRRDTCACRASGPTAQPGGDPANDR